MSILVDIDFNEELPFTITPWTLGAWPLDSLINGIRNNTISHSQATSFSVPAKWEYLKITFRTQSETNYDYFQIFKDDVEIYSARGAAQNTDIVVEKTFDGALSTLKFSYRKDGSGSSGVDGIVIRNMQYKTVDDSLLQYSSKFGVEATDGAIYTVQNGIVTKVADNIQAMTKTLYETFTIDKNIINIYDDRFGLTPKLLKYDTDINKTYLAIKHKCISRSEPLLLIKSYNLNYPYIAGIQNFVIDVTKSLDDVVRVIFSVDDGLTWVVFNGTDWVPLVDTSWDTVLLQGMNIEDVTSLNGTQFDVLFSTKKIKVGILLKPSNVNSTLRINSFRCNYIIVEPTTLAEEGGII